jgi:hypothetical protein
MTFTYREAKRENVPLLLGLAGGTGSGKTWSAMTLAKGLAGEKRFAVVDTENGRAKHYADEFAFDVADLTAPFRPERYSEAILAADAAGYSVIVVDSMSHEWAGDGGLLDWHEEEYQRLGNRDAVKMTAWIAPKMAHRKMVTRLLQVSAHVILCFRAAGRVDMVRDDKGKMQVVPKRTLTGLDGWVPITEKDLPFELTLSLLLTADKPGVPKPIKLQEQHRSMVPLDQPLAEATGRALGEWARGADDSAALRSRLLELAARIGKADETTAALAEKPRDSAWLRRAVAKAEKALSEDAAVGQEAGSGSASIPGEPERAASSESAPDSGEQSQFADMMPASARHEDRG